MPMEPHPLTPYPPLLINACLTGMVPTKEQSALLPVTPEEIVADAIRVADVGAQIVHVHARDGDGRPTWQARVYQEILEAIRRERPGLICCVSTSGRLWSEIEKRTEVLLLDGAARPDMASLTLGSLNFRSGTHVSSMADIERLLATMLERGILPELEAFDLGMLAYARYLQSHGLLGKRLYFNLLLGSLGCIPATIGNLWAMLQELPDGAVWAGGGIGVFQLPMTAAAIVAGGGVRVGLEDNLHADPGRKRLASNVDLVQRVVRIAEDCGRRIATPAEVRDWLGLPAPGR